MPVTMPRTLTVVAVARRVGAERLDLRDLRDAVRRPVGAGSVPQLSAPPAAREVGGVVVGVLRPVGLAREGVVAVGGREGEPGALAVARTPAPSGLAADGVDHVPAALRSCDAARVADAGGVRLVARTGRVRPPVRERGTSAARGERASRRGSSRAAASCPCRSCSSRPASSRRCATVVGRLVLEHDELVVAARGAAELHLRDHDRGRGRRVGGGRRTAPRRAALRRSPQKTKLHGSGVLSAKESGRRRANRIVAPEAGVTVR